MWGVCEGLQPEGKPQYQRIHSGKKPYKCACYAKALRWGSSRTSIVTRSHLSVTNVGKALVTSHSSGCTREPTLGPYECSACAKAFSLA